MIALQGETLGGQWKRNGFISKTNIILPESISVS